MWKNLSKPPQPADTKIVFRLSPQTHLFDSSSYSSELTDGRANIQEIDQVLKDVLETWKPVQEEIDRKLIRFARILFIMALAIMIIITPIVLLQVLQSMYLVLVLVILMSPPMVFTFITIINTFKMRKNALRAVKESLDQHNLRFVDKGLRWNATFIFPSEIELNKDYLVSNQAQGLYVPLNEQRLA